MPGLRMGALVLLGFLSGFFLACEGLTVAKPSPPDAPIPEGDCCCRWVGRTTRHLGDEIRWNRSTPEWCAAQDRGSCKVGAECPLRD